MSFIAGPIVVLSEQSSEADEAIRQAWRIAEQTGDPFHVCHVFPERVALESLFPGLEIGESFRLAELEGEARAGLSARVRLLTGASGDAFHLGFDQGSVHGGLLRYAEHVRAGLVLVGVDGTERAQGITLDVAERVVRHGPCSVLLVRPGRTGGVVVATDLSPAATAAVAAGVQEAARRHKDLTTVHVIDYLAASDEKVPAAAPALTAANRERIRTAAADRVAAGVSRSQAKVTTMVREGEAVAQILQIVDALNSDLLVVGTHGRTGLPRLALGSVAETLLRRAPCSLLFVREAPWAGGETPR